MPDTAISQVQPVLPDAEVARRVTLLADLQAALTALKVQSVLARNHRLVLLSAGNGPEPSGPTSPQLHIFFDDGTVIATTDGTRYEFTAAPARPAGDPQAAAASLLNRLRIQPQEQPR